MIGYTRLTAKASENQKGGGWGLGNGETLSLAQIILMPE